MLDFFHLDVSMLSKSLVQLRLIVSASDLLHIDLLLLPQLFGQPRSSCVMFAMARLDVLMTMPDLVNIEASSLSRSLAIIGLTMFISDPLHLGSLLLSQSHTRPELVVPSLGLACLDSLFFLSAIDSTHLDSSPILQSHFQLAPTASVLDFSHLNTLSRYVFWLEQISLSSYLACLALACPYFRWILPIRIPGCCCVVSADQKHSCLQRTTCLALSSCIAQFGSALPVLDYSVFGPIFSIRSLVRTDSQTLVPNLLHLELLLSSHLFACMDATVLTFSMSYLDLLLLATQYVMVRVALPLRLPVYLSIASSVSNFTHFGPSVFLQFSAQTASLSLVLSLSHLGASPSLHSLACTKLSALFLSSSCLGALFSPLTLAFTHLGSLLLLRSLAQLTLVALVLDSAHADMLLPPRSITRFNVSILPFGPACSGSPLSTIDLVHVELVTSSHSFACLRPASFSLDPSHLSFSMSSR